MKKPVAILSSILLAGSIAMTGAIPAMANDNARNNHTNRNFSFSFAADGTDYAIAPREKQDSSKAYVKNKASGSSIDVDVFVCGTANVNKYSGIDPNRCSSRYSVKAGNYQYMSNTVYGKYKYD